MRPRYKPVNPDKWIRELRKDFKSLRKEDPSPDRAERLAEFTRQAHEVRQLNMSMHTAAMCLEDDPDAPRLLIAAYEVGDDPEERLRAMVDLEDLGRYIDRPDLVEHARGRIDTDARAWVRDGDEAEQRARLRTLASMRDRAFADTIRDEIQFG